MSNPVTPQVLRQNTAHEDIATRGTMKEAEFISALLLGIATRVSCGEVAVHVVSPTTDFNNGFAKLGRRPFTTEFRQKRFLSSMPTVSDFTVPSRNRTLALMRLNVAAYPSCEVRIQRGFDCSYPEDVMAEIFENNLSIFGPNISGMEQENMATQILNEQIWNESGGGSHEMFRKISVPQETAEFEFGVQALEWNRADATILAFRGTFTDGDYTNIENWMIDYLLEKSTDRMKQAWIQDAGLEWTAEMEERSRVDDRWAKLEIRAGESYILGRNRPLKDGLTRKESVMQRLVDAVAMNDTLSSAIGGFTMKDAEATGYWKLTKLIVDEAAILARENNRTLVLTGHSQGGTRAQFASMYLYRTTGIAHPTITFAATGGACAARLTFDSNGNFLEDVDPFVRHENMVEYVHPLDPWGNSMLGMDNGNSVCYWGKLEAKLAEASRSDVLEDFNVGAYHYCSKIYGWPGPSIIAAQAGLSGDNELRRNFQRCRYFTHMAETILFGLEKNLLEDGTTDGGCVSLSVISRQDPDQMCPTGKLSLEEKHAVEGILFVMVVMLLGCLLLARSWIICKRNHTKMHEILSTEEYPMDGWGDNESISMELPQMS